VIAGEQRSSGAGAAWRKGRPRQAIAAETITHCVPRQAVWKLWRLAVRVPRKAIYIAAALGFDYEIVIYSASSDALRVRLLVFLELWLGTYPMGCGSG